MRSILGRFFNTNNNEVSSSSSYYSGPGEISSPYNTVHRIHVGYDGKKFTGLPQPWMDTLLRDIRLMVDVSVEVREFIRWELTVTRINVGVKACKATFKIM